MVDVLFIVGMLVVFTLVGGFYAAAEVALIALRESQVQRLARTAGRRGQRLGALEADPNRFLAAVQVGVTLAGFVTAGFGASRLVPVVAPWLIDLGIGQMLSHTLAFIGITLALAFLSLVLAELVPKRIALQRTQEVALASARVVDLTAVVAKPFIWLVSKATNATVRLLGLDPAEAKEGISSEELREIVARQSSLSMDERDIIEDVFGADQVVLSEVMVPRTEVEFLPAAMTVEEAARVAARLPHSRYPVVAGGPDHVVGFVHLRELLDPGREARDIPVGDIVREVVRFPDSKQILPALHELRERRAHLALVIDEYGGTAGIVTLEDLVEEIVGEIADEYDPPGEAPNTDRWEIEGRLPLEEFHHRTGVSLPRGPYETVGGFVLAALGRLAMTGDVVQVPAARLTVVAMDGQRISQIAVQPTASPADETKES